MKPAWQPVRIALVALLLAIGAPWRANAAVGGDMTITSDVAALTALAGTLTVDQTSHRLLAAAAGVIHVMNAHIGGAYLAAGRVVVDDSTFDRLLIAAGEIKVNSRIGGTLTAAGGTVVLTSDTRVGGNANLAGGEIAVDGTIAGDLRANAAIITVAGTIKGSVRLTGTTLAVTPGTQIGGDLVYRSTQPLTLPADAIVRGKVVRETGAPHRGGRWVFRAFAIFIAAAATGALAVRFAPTLMASAQQELRRSPGLSLAVGLCVALALPAAAIALAITRIGAPLAMLAIAALAMVATLGLVIACREAGALAGARIAQIHLSPWIWAIGAFVIFALIGRAPVVGPVAQLLILAAGSGALALAAWRAGTA